MQKMRNLLILTGLLLLSGRMLAQDIYANSETNSSTAGTCTACGVTNSTNAIDANLSNFATIGMRTAVTGGQVQQTYSFPTAGLAGDTVVFNLEIPYSPNNLDPNSIIFNSLNGGVSNAEAFTTLLRTVAPSGGGSFQFIFYPQANYDQVQLILNARTVVTPLAFADSINVYSVRILKSLANPSTPMPIAGCENPVSTTDSVGALCLGFCSVNNPSHIVTSDPADFATLRVNTLLPGTFAMLTGYYADTACFSDTVVIAIENSNGQIAQTQYPAITINAMLGNTVVAGGTLNTFNASDITLVGNVYYIRFLPGVQFNGIRVTNTSVFPSTNSIAQLRVYQYCLRKLAPPVPNAGRVANICYNTSHTFTTTAPPQTIARYYDAPTGGTQLGSGPSYTTGLLTDTTTIYFESFDTVNFCVSTLRDSIVINVYPQVTPPNSPQDTVWICYNNRAIVAPQPYGSIYNFYSDPAGINKLAKGQFYVTDTILTDTVLYVENTYLGICDGGVFVPVYIKLIPDPFVADIADTIIYCLNSTVDIQIKEQQPGITYRWYASDSTLVYTGNPYTNYLADKDSVLYIETVAGACAQSPNRKRVDVLTVDQASLTVSIPSPIYVCDDDTATALASSTSTHPNLVFEWFNAQGNIVFTGNPFLIRSPIDSTSFTVGTRVDQCASAFRADYTLINLNTITDQDFDSLVTICDGDSAYLTSNIKVPGAIYSWFDSPFATTPVFVGDTFVTGPLNNPVTYFYELSNVNCLNGTTRHRLDVRVFAQPPVITVDTNLVYFCTGDFATVSAKATPTPAVVTWWDAPGNGTKLFTGDTFRFTPNVDTVLVYAEARVSQCVSTNRSPVLVVRADNIRGVTALNDTICEGSSTQLTAFSQIVGGDFSWWDQAVGGTRLASGNPFNTPILNNSTTYYVNVEFNSNICKDSPRTAVRVVVERILTAPVVSCGPSNNASLSFVWSGDPNTVSYEISLNGGASFFAPNNALGPRSHQINGLTPDTVITAIVRSIGARPCQNSAYSTATSCRATDCTPVNSKLDKAFYEICDDQTATILVQDLPQNYRVEFNGGAATTNTTFNYANAQPGTYVLPIKVYVQGEIGCDTLLLEATIVVHESPNARIDAIALTPAVSGAYINTFQFLSNTGGAMNWNWNFGDGGTSNQQNPVHQYTADGEYQITLYVVDQNGCDDSDTLDRLIKVSRVPEIFIPNTFTPNVDGKNDLFRAYGQNIRLISMKIFNTYGNMVFESNELERGWDGQYNGDPAPSGTYYYTAIIIDELDIKYEREGTITLIRK